MLGSLLNKPIVITLAQLNNIRIQVESSEDEISLMTLEDYLTSKVVKELYTILRGE